MENNILGEFVLVDENKIEYQLCDGTSIIYIDNEKIIVGGDIIDTEFSFIVNIAKDKIQIRKDKGVLKIDDNIITDSSSLHDNTIISVGGVSLEFKFVHLQTELESIIDLFMDGNLELPINMERLFLEYAKMLKISEKKAISNMMAVIDIPEIDKL